MPRCCIFQFVENDTVSHFSELEPGELVSCHAVVGRDLQSADDDDFMLYGEQWMNQAAAAGNMPRWTVVIHVAYYGEKELEALQDQIAAERKLTADDVVALYHPRLFDDRFDDAIAAIERED
jgi:hypothetical protein